jgi:hypothetical protein
MVDIPGRLKQRGGVGLPSRAEMHIFRSPPSSYMTRKHETVSEADVMWMTRTGDSSSDPTRLSENISYFAKGVNPSVAVSYQNRGGGSSTTHLNNNQQAGSVYKIDVVRPPLFPIETRLPLSRPRTHQNISVESNPGLSSSHATMSGVNTMDKVLVQNAINIIKSSGPNTIQATAYYKIDVPTVMSAKYAINENRPANYQTMTNPNKNIDIKDFVCRETTPYGVIIRPTHYTMTSNVSGERTDNLNRDASHGVIDNPNRYSMTSNVIGDKIDNLNRDASSQVKKDILFQNIRPNFNIILYDPSNHVSTEVSANIKERNHIAAQAAIGAPIVVNRPDGTQIKLKDYNWTAVNTNVGIDQVILTIEDPNIQLERNIPLYSSSGGLTAPTDVIPRRNTDYDLEGKVAVYAQPNMDLSTYYNEQNARDLQQIRLNKNIITSSYDNQTSSRPIQYKRELPNLKNNSRSKYAATQHYERLFE